MTPWVGIIPPDLPLVADPAELDAIFEVPLSHFLDDQRTHTDVITVDGVAHYVQLSRRWSRDLGIICHDVGGAVGRGFWNGD